MSRRFVSERPPTRRTGTLSRSHGETLAKHAAGWGDWGTMGITRVGTQIRGVYTYRDGTVLLGERDKDGWYRGCWSEASRDPNTNGDFGVVWFRVREDGSLDGRSQHLEPQTWLEDWDLTRSADAKIPAADQACFADSAQFVLCK
jgi:hypothetical protein